MAVVVGRMLVTLEAQTANFEAKLTAAGQQLGRWTSVTASAHRGTNLLRTGLQQLALEGLGGMPPALARVSTGLLTLFGPGAILTVAIAILGGLALAFDHAAKKAEEFEDANRKLRDFQMQHNKMLAGIGPEISQTPAEQLASLLQQRADVQAQIAARQTMVQPNWVTALGIEDPVSKRARAEISVFTADLQKFNHAIIDLGRSVKLAAIELTQAQHAENFLIRHSLSATLRSVITGPEFGAGFDLRAPGFGQGGRFGDPGGFAQIGRHAQVAGPGDRVPGGFQLTPQAAQMLLFSLMAMQGGGSQGALMGLGGLATGVSALKGVGAAAGPLGWIGFGISALATLFGSKADEKERNDQRRHQELIGVLHEGPARISQYFEGDPEASLYQNRRLERLGGEPRNGGL